MVFAVSWIHLKHVFGTHSRTEGIYQKPLFWWSDLLQEEDQEPDSWLCPLVLGRLELHGNHERTGRCHPSHPSPHRVAMLYLNWRRFPEIRPKTTGPYHVCFESEKGKLTDLAHWDGKDWIRPQDYLGFEKIPYAEYGIRLFAWAEIHNNVPPPAFGPDRNSFSD